MTRSLPQRVLPLLHAVLLIVVTAPLMMAQFTDGRISVTVLDPQKAVIPGAGLELKDLATNETRMATTQSAGTFTFVNLKPGKYTLTISAEGFQPELRDVVVSGTKSTDIEATLKLGVETEVIKVDTPATPVVE